MPGNRGFKAAVVVSTALLGALLGVGCVLAALFELQGFGTPRDTEPRRWYLASLGVGLVLCVAVPLGLWRLLLPQTAPAARWLAPAAAAVVVLAVLGVTAAR